MAERLFAYLLENARKKIKKNKITCLLNKLLFYMIQDIDQMVNIFLLNLKPRD